MAQDLLSDFEQGTEEQWLEKINIDLKGKTLESLFWESEIGKINPVIFDSENVTSDNFQKTENNNWNIRQSFDAAAPDANKQILLALQGGVNAIEINNLSALNINSVLNEVMLDLIQVSIDINTNDPLSTIQVFSDYCTSKSIRTENLEGGFIYDPIGNVALTGNWHCDEKTDLGLIKEILLAAEQFEKFSILNINTAIYCNGGANIDTQTAYAIAQGNEYLNLFKGEPSFLEKIIQKTEFTFGMGTSYFLEIAKLRAFRSLWSTVVDQYTSIDIIETKVHAINANLYYSNNDIYNNLLRATSSGMSAIISGCNSLTLLPFNYNSVKSDEFGQRISKNIQLLLQEESYLNQVKDTSKGSYYVESLINTIKKNSWKGFLAIEKNGGIISALKNGTIQDQISKELDKKATDLKEENRIIIGVNRFINEEEEHSSNLKLEDNIENTSIKPVPQIRLAVIYE